MNKTAEPHFEILEAEQKRVWPSLAEATAQDFVLYGGLALALQLGHRHSQDFDLFRAKPFTTAELQKKIPLIRRGLIIQEAENTLTVSIPDANGKGATKLSFFGGVGFVANAKRHATPDRVVNIADLGELMAAKLTVILQRVEARDYQDIAALIRAGVSVAAGMKRAKETHPQFPMQEALKAMVYFGEDALKAVTVKDRKAREKGALAAEKELAGTAAKKGA